MISGSEKEQTGLGMDSLQAPGCAVRSTRQRLARRFHNVRVLIAHPNPQLRTVVAAALRGSGCNVNTEQEVRDILVNLSEVLLHRHHAQRPDLIVTDLGHRATGGLQLVQDLRKAGWTTPILLTARSESPHIVQAVLRYDKVVVFQTPFEIEDLLTAAYFLLEHRQSHPFAPVHSIVQLSHPQADNDSSGGF